MGVMDNGRSWTCTVYVYDIQFGNPAQTGSVTWVLTGTYPNTKIKNWKLTDTMAQNGDVAFGSTGSKALTLELADLASKDFGTGAIVGVVLGGAASGSWYFYADSVEWTANYGTTTRYSAKVTAYDTMYYAANRISSVNLPSPHYTDMIVNGKATVQDCRDIAQYCIRHARYDLIRERARELADDPTTTPSDKTRYETYANMVDSQYDEGYVPYTRTMDDVVSNAVGKVNIDAVGGYMQKITIDKTMTGRSLLGRMAAFMGMRAYCNNNVIGNIGKISFESLLGSSYNNDVPVDRKDVYDNGFVAEGKKSFKYFMSGTTENPATAGKKTSNGFSTMVVNCPDMDSSRLNSLASGMAGKEYEIGKVKFRGDPALKAGMKVKFPDAGNNIHEAVATKVVSNYDGGFYQTVYSEGKSDADIQFEQNRYAENATEAAEQKDPDAGGGGGTPTLLYYSETESPDKATIDVNGKSIEVDNGGVTITGTTDINGGTTVTGNLSVNGDISCTGSISYGGTTFNSDVTITGSAPSSPTKLIFEHYYSEGGLDIRARSYLDTFHWRGIDIANSWKRDRIENSISYSATNYISLCTRDPDSMYDGASLIERKYGTLPCVFLRQDREKEYAINEGISYALLTVDQLHFADRWLTYNVSGMTVNKPYGGVAIGYNYSSDNTTPPKFVFKFYSRQGMGVSEYEITEANIAALAQLT